MVEPDRTPMTVRRTHIVHWISEATKHAENMHHCIGLYMNALECCVIRTVACLAIFITVTFVP
jgi:hypothetical protein